jgi:hypothetical protein
MPEEMTGFFLSQACSASIKVTYHQQQVKQLYCSIGRGRAPYDSWAAAETITTKLVVLSRNDIYFNILFDHLSCL